MQPGPCRKRVTTVRWFCAFVTLLLGLELVGSAMQKCARSRDVIVSQTGPAAFIGTSITQTLDIFAELSTGRAESAAA